MFDHIVYISHHRAAEGFMYLYGTPCRSVLYIPDNMVSAENIYICSADH